MKQMKKSSPEDILVDHHETILGSCGWSIAIEWHLWMTVSDKYPEDKLHFIDIIMDSSRGLITEK